MQICQHFGVCGGCKFLDIPYREQVSLKTEKIKKLISEHNFSVPLLSANTFNQYYYRNKMEFTFSESNGLICGMYSRKDKGKVFHIKQCLIFSPDTGVILDAVCKFANQQGYTAYNKFSHKGFL